MNGELIKEYLKEGKEFMERRLYGKALRCFNFILEIDPKNVEAWIWRGKALAKLHRYVKAVKSFNCALLIDRKCVEAWILKAQTLRILGQFKQEWECYEKVKEINPSFKPHSE